MITMMMITMMMMLYHFKFVVQPGLIHHAVRNVHFDDEYHVGNVIYVFL